jgi:hypothetical protein
MPLTSVSNVADGTLEVEADAVAMVEVIGNDARNAREGIERVDLSRELRLDDTAARQTQQN